MAKNLLIVESPSKAKTLQKYLGSDFKILASYGHVRDLIPKSGAIDTENQFAMKYAVIARNSKHIDAIVAAAKQAENLYLATDPDREGEAISWHLQEILRSKRVPKSLNMQRVVFHEVTKKAVLDAVANPRELSLTLVDAQQARRALDYLVGFNLSPLLWKKIRRGLSAGRVQSPALRLICERENEIKAFETQEYHSVHLESSKNNITFQAKLTHWQGKKLEQFDLPDQAASDAVLSALKGQNGSVVAIEKKQRSRNPAAPFTTSTLQQEAVRKLGISTDRTMRAAQQLYEGVDVGEGAVGLITYMRTDSVTLSSEAVAEIRHFIDTKIGGDYLPSSPKVYRTKSKNAQEAHEAIRPTSVYRTPELVKSFLSPDQFRLYQMIWQRTVASQMTAAKFDTTAIDISASKGLFRLNGQVQTFAGFLSVYEEGKEDEDIGEEGKRLPAFKKGEVIDVKRFFAEQHFTQPPARYSEANLVKALEEFGIGRPSTYATIISTLKERDYVTLENRRFLPTSTGEIVNKFLTEHFNQYFDYHFTAKLEDQLDDIANGKRNWIKVMSKFWDAFSQEISAKSGIPRAQITTEELDEVCPKCGNHKLQMKFGKRGHFIACSGYPECDYTRNANESAEEAAREAEEPTVVEGRECPKCNGKLVYKKGRFGKFIACSSYPKCKHTEPLEKPKDTGVACPKCGKGHLIERKSRYGKLFYSCNTYPDCDYATWYTPINETCPQCGWPVLTLKTTKKSGTSKVCPQKECGWSEPVPESDVQLAES